MARGRPRKRTNKIQGSEQRSLSTKKMDCSIGQNIHGATQQSTGKTRLKEPADANPSIDAQGRLIDHLCSTRKDGPTTEGEGWQIATSKATARPIAQVNQQQAIGSPNTFNILRSTQ
ncbi:hypothetical protein HAX54_016412 [Datura stramonium]|uniref:Uncharacterized protein n=1 Tax=Datura stramonium TaxID=4076 RepID=A0ABS8UIZ4_DATST|nr:hypothetical protein [Datura stramonium]